MKNKDSLLDSLKEYFKTTSREKLLEDWAKSSEFDSVSPLVEEFLHNTEESVKYCKNVQKKQELNMTIQELIDKYPNDMQLGASVRKMFSNNPPLDRVIHSTEDGFVEGDPIFEKLEDTTRKKDKDQEILSIKYGNEIFKSDEFGIDRIIEGSMRFEGDNKWTIHQVKRLSDGLVFTIGDYVKFPTIRGNITAITEHYVAINYVTTSIANISYAFTKAKKVFTTLDGVDVYFGDIVYCVHRDDNSIVTGIVSETKVSPYPYSKEVPVFSTEEKAIDYVRMNAIKYSLKDVQDAYKKLISSGQTPSYRTPNIDEISLSLEKINKVENEEDFTILSFIDKATIYDRNENGKFNGGVGLCRNKLTLKYFKDNNIPIHSIQRNSDNAVFKLNDKIKHNSVNYGSITKILSNGHVCCGDICFLVRFVEHA